MVITHAIIFSDMANASVREKCYFRTTFFVIDVSFGLNKLQKRDSS